MFRPGPPTVPGAGSRGQSARPLLAAGEGPEEDVNDDDTHENADRADCFDSCGPDHVGRRAGARPASRTVVAAGRRRCAADPDGALPGAAADGGREADPG